jgi:hypothetical protein
MDQLQVVAPPAPTPLAELGPAREPAVGQPDISVLLKGNRLEITASVDADGLAKLKDVLAKYEEILRMLE